MSLPPYSEYKNSRLDWLTQVPVHWPVTKTKHVCRFSTGWTPPTGNSAAYEGENHWANISDLGAKTINETAKRISDAAIADAAIPVSPSGSLLFSFKLSIGQVSFAGRDMYTNEAIATFRRSSNLDLAFAYFAFPLFLVQNAVENIYGAKLLNQELIRGATFALPPVDEQTAIAGFLSRETGKIDALIAEQEKLITLLAEKRQATISHAVTRGLNPDAPMKDSGVAWLGDVPAHWQTKQLKHVARQGTSITYGIVQAGPHHEGGIPYIKTSDMAGDSLPVDGYALTSPEIDASYARSKVASGDVVIAIRATVGKCLPVPPELAGANLTQGTAKVSPGADVVPAFLLASLRSDAAQSYFDSMAKGATFKEITLDALRRTPALLPPIDEQLDIVNFVESETKKLSMLEVAAKRVVALLKERRSALIAAAVTGQIDVRGAVVTAEGP